MKMRTALRGTFFGALVVLCSVVLEAAGQNPAPVAPDPKKLSDAVSNFSAKTKDCLDQLMQSVDDIAKALDPQASAPSQPAAAPAKVEIKLDEKSSTPTQQTAAPAKGKVKEKAKPAAKPKKTVEERLTDVERELDYYKVVKIDGKLIPIDKQVKDLTSAVRGNTAQSKEQGKKLEEHDGRITQVEGRVEVTEKKLEELSTSLQSVQGAMDGLKRPIGLEPPAPPAPAQPASAKPKEGSVSLLGASVMGVGADLDINASAEPTSLFEGHFLGKKLRFWKGKK